MEKPEILDVIREAIMDISPYAENLATATDRDLKNSNVCFVDLGINSINYAEIMLIVMDKLNLNFSLDMFTRTNNINDAVDILHDLKSARV